MTRTLFRSKDNHGVTLKSIWAILLKILANIVLGPKTKNRLHLGHACQGLQAQFLS